MNTIFTLFLQFSPQIVWRISTEILHHHPNSKMEDYNIIYERMKHSGVRHYLMVCWLVIPAAQRFFYIAETHLRPVVCISRSVWNIHSTCCLMVTLRMQSVSCLLLKVGGMGRSQELSVRGLNWSRPTGVYWIISSGVTKSSHSPTVVRRYTSCYPRHLFFAYIFQTGSCLISHCHLQVRPSNYSDKSSVKQMVNLQETCLCAELFH